MAIRFLYRFESADATQGKTWPTNLYEYEQGQDLLASSLALTGAGYEFDQLGSAPAVKADATERVRFLVTGTQASIDQTIDELKALANIGRGRVWTKGAAGDFRWAWARMTVMPALSLSFENLGHAPVSLTFVRSSDWHDEETIGYEGEFTLSSDPETINVVNPGNAPVYDAIITVKGAFSGLVITNNSALVPGTETPYVLETASIGASAADWIRFDAGRNTVEISNDSGATWTDDSGNFVRADGQVRLMVFGPGANELVVDGAASCDVVVEMYGAWH